jgi:hypothetical protein
LCLSRKSTGAVIAVLLGVLAEHDEGETLRWARGMDVLAALEATRA